MQAPFLKYCRERSSLSVTGSSTSEPLLPRSCWSEAAKRFRQCCLAWCDSAGNWGRGRLPSWSSCTGTQSYAARLPGSTTAALCSSQAVGAHWDSSLLLQPFSQCRSKSLRVRSRGPTLRSGSILLPPVSPSLHLSRPRSTPPPP